MNQISDLQDNDLCNSIQNFLNKSNEFLGTKLYTDILYFDLNSDQYFEIYYDFNLKRILNEIDNIKLQLFPATKSPSNPQVNQKAKNAPKRQTTLISPSVSSLIKKQQEEQEEQHKFLLKQQMLFNLKHLINTYTKNEELIDRVIQLYEEYYENMMNPLKELNELTTNELKRFEMKLVNQEKSSKLLASKQNADAILELKNKVKQAKTDINGLTGNMEQINAEHLLKVVQFYENILTRMKKDRDKLSQQANLSFNLNEMFDILTKKRRDQ